MKAAVDELLSQDSVNLADLWQRLQAPPSGLLPAPISITLFGLLLRECGTGYYWYDGTTSHSLDLTRLGELIKDTMDGKSGQVLQKSSQEERRFCALVGEIYRLDGNSTKYLIPARDALRAHFGRIGFPLWSLAHYLEAKEGHERCDSIQALGDLLASRENEGYAAPERLRTLVAQVEEDKSLLKELNAVDCYQAGMRYFLEQQDCRVAQILSALGISTKDLMVRLKKLLEEEVWLWEEQEIAMRLPALLDELDLIGALAQLADVQIHEMAGAVAAIAKMVRPGRLPVFVLAHQQDDELASIMSSLADALELGSSYARKAALAQAIREHNEAMRRAISHPAEALRAWVSQAMQRELSEVETERLWAELPDLSAAQRDDEIRNAVRQLLQAMERNRAIAELRETWRQYTQTESPDVWSDGQQVPLSWLIEPTQTWVLDIVQRPERVTIEAVREAQHALNRLAPALRALAADGRADARFVDIVAGAYRVFVQDKDEIDQLKRYLRQSLGQSVSRWGQAEARETTLTWIGSQYRDRYLPRVLKTLDATPEASMRSLLGELVRDPLVGVRLLALEQKHED